VPRTPTATRALLGKHPAFLKLYVECLKLVGLERRAIAPAGGSWTRRSRG
jgi:hypothetical protein